MDSFKVRLKAKTNEPRRMSKAAREKHHLHKMQDAETYSDKPASDKARANLRMLSKKRWWEALTQL